MKLKVFIEINSNQDDPRGHIGRIQKEFDWEIPQVGSHWQLPQFADASKVLEVYHCPEEGCVEVQIESMSPGYMWDLLESNTGWINPDAH